MALSVEDTRKRSALFSVADRQMEGIISQEQFDRSLVLAVLFQPYILVPDIFFFISSLLSSHFNERPMSLFERALQNGIIMPSFRNPECFDFGHALDVIVEQNIRGLLPNACQIAARLNLSIERATKFRHLHWPTNRLLAGQYMALMKRCLTSEGPPWTGNDAEFKILENVWKKGAIWREQCLEQAIRESNGGLMRGKYMECIGRTVGLNGPVDDIRDLFFSAKQAGCSPAELDALRGVCNIMCYAYVYNQAIEQGSYADFPHYDAFVKVILASEQEVYPHGKSPISWPTVQQVVEVPTVNALLSADANALMDVRMDIFPDYMASVEQWQRYPTGVNADKMCETMAAYARAITDAAQTGQIRGLIVTHGSTPGFQVATQGLGVVATGGAATGVVETWQLDMPNLIKNASVGLAILLAIGNFGYSLFQWRARRKSIDKEEGVITLKANPELTLPTPDQAAIR